jgi:hypothetical protein
VSRNAVLVGFAGVAWVLIYKKILFGVTAPKKFLARQFRLGSEKIANNGFALTTSTTRTIRDEKNITGYRRAIFGDWTFGH